MKNAISLIYRFKSIVKKKLEHERDNAGNIESQTKYRSRREYTYKNTRAIQKTHYLASNKNP